MSGVESDTLTITNAGKWLDNKVVYCEAYNGKYKLSDAALITVKSIVMGDVNADDVFDISDAVTLQKWLINKSDAALTNWRAGNLCKDSMINVFDLCIMKRKLLETS